jgi:hypothetical protein
MISAKRASLYYKEERVVNTIVYYSVWRFFIPGWTSKFWLDVRNVIIGFCGIFKVT